MCYLVMDRMCKDKMRQDINVVVGERIRGQRHRSILYLTSAHCGRNYLFKRVVQM